jgi:hypothetical protein
MAAGFKFQNLINDLMVAKTMAPNTDTFTMLLTNVLPINTQHLYPTNFVSEIANGNGYVTGGLPVTGVAISYAAGVATMTGTLPTLTPTGSVGPWRYFVVVDITTGTLCIWGDYGASTTVTTGQPIPFSAVGNVLATFGP